MNTWIIVILACIICQLCTPSDALSVGDIVDNVKNFFSSSTNNDDVQPAKKSKDTRPKQRGIFVEPAHPDGITIADYSRHDLPKIEQGGRVLDLFNGMHFDDVLRDTPDDMRPPSIVLFYDSTDPSCMQKFRDFGYREEAERNMYSRERVLIAKYDMSTVKHRTWYEFTPEMDLAKRFNVEGCGKLAYVPRRCNGWTEWCVQGKDPEDENIEIIGCEDFKDQCTGVEFWDGKGYWVSWAIDKIDSEGEPKISEFLGSYAEQSRWIKDREYTTTTTHVRNNYLSHSFPGFTKTGYKAMPTPPEVQDFLLKFHKDYEGKRKKESWDALSTQLSYHEKRTDFIDMDMVRKQKNDIANKYIKPIVEEWSNMQPLELTSFYGIREYPEGSWLREHIDRIDTHVLSVTFSIDKRNTNDSSKPWPLQVIRWDGKIVRYDHPPGTMVLYESSKLPHGRPFRNEGGVHLGAFVHFKPTITDKIKAKAWDEIAEKARRYQNLMVTHIPYRSQEPIEPAKPVFSEHSFGEGSRFKHNAKDDESPERTVNFINKSNKMLSVFWIGSNNKVLQSRLAPNAQVEINSFIGHKFVWADPKTEEPVEDGYFQIVNGKKDYVYSIIADAGPSKWKKKVEDKFATEEEMEHDARLNKREEL